MLSIDTMVCVVIRNRMRFIIVFVSQQDKCLESGLPGVPGLPVVKHVVVERRLVNARVTIPPQPTAEQHAWVQCRRYKLALTVIAQVSSDFLIAGLRSLDAIKYNPLA